MHAARVLTCSVSAANMAIQARGLYVQLLVLASLWRAPQYIDEVSCRGAATRRAGWDEGDRHGPRALAIISAQSIMDREHLLLSAMSVAAWTVGAVSLGACLLAALAEACVVIQAEIA